MRFPVTPTGLTAAPLHFRVLARPGEEAAGLLLVPDLGGPVVLAALAEEGPELPHPETETSEVRVFLGKETVAELAGLARAHPAEAEAVAREP